MRHGHAEALLPIIDRVMKEARLTPALLDAVAVATGPGGFTGIRVGLAAAHGITLAVGARLVGITGFAAVAARIAGRRASGSERLLVALDSRRADIYVQLFAGDAPLAAPQAVLPDQLSEYVGPDATGMGLLIAGDAAEIAAAALSGHMCCKVSRESAPDAAGVAAAALAELRAGTIPRPVRPFYLRPPDVTLPTRPLVASSR